MNGHANAAAGALREAPVLVAVGVVLLVLALVLGEWGSGGVGEWGPGVGKWCLEEKEGKDRGPRSQGGREGDAGVGRELN